VETRIVKKKGLPLQKPAKGEKKMRRERRFGEKERKDLAPVAVILIEKGGKDLKGNDEKKGG